MTITPASLRGHGHGPLPRFVLLGCLVVALVIIGLLLMHGLNLHGTPAAQHQGVVSAMPAGVNVAEGSHGDPGTAVGSIMLACEGCDHDGQHLGTAAACVLALFVTLLLLRRPAEKRLRGICLSRAAPALCIIVSSRPRTPTLHELCISRT